MSIQVTIDGLDYDVDVTMIDSPSDIDPETYMALRGLKGDKGDTGSAGADGSDGSDGADGVGITSITQNLDGTLSINLTDGTSYETEPLKGDKGDTGEKGDAFTYDDFTPEQLASLKGDKGDTGESGVYIGETAPSDPDVNVWIDTSDPEPSSASCGVLLVYNGTSWVAQALNTWEGGNY